MSMGSLVGGETGNILTGGGTVDIPGDPGALAQASSVYAQAAGGFGDAASRLRSSLGEVASWQGVGATAHAQRVQALAAAHEVAHDAMTIGSQGLAAYSRDLAAAQAMARRANAAIANAAQTANQLQATNNQAANGSMFATAANGYMPPAVQASFQATQLQHTLDGQQAQARALGGQARLLAQQAATRAGACFAHVASMAGNSALHGSADPWTAYLGVDQPGQAAALIEAGGVLGGQGGEPTATALGDLASAQPGSANANLAGLYIVRDGQYGTDVNHMLDWLRGQGVTGNLQPGFDQLSPTMQAALLAQRVKDIKAHGTSSTGLTIGSDALHAVAFLAAGGAVVLTVASLLQGGVDPLTDGGTVGADAGATAADAGATDLAGQAARVQFLNRLATVAGTGALVTDTSQQVITGHFDAPQIVLDSLAVVPGAGAAAMDTRVLTLGAQGADAGAIANAEAVSKVLAVHSYGFGLSGGVYGGSAWVYQAANGEGG